MRVDALAEWTRSGGAVLAILLALLAVICLGGGASRVDALGQGFVRAAALLAVAGWVVAGARFDLRRIRGPFAILCGAISLVAVQLVPLPFGVWSGLPGRGLLVEITQAAGLEGEWRPIASVPDSALNALLSLLVPFAVMLGVSASSARHARGLVPVLLGMVGLSAIVALFQLSTGGVDNPLINDPLGQPSGLFANRNHQALFLGLGVLLAFGWGFDPSRRLNWRSWTALGVVAFFALMVLATGSRAGLGLLALALLFGILIARPTLRRAWKRGPSWIEPAVGAAALLLVAGLASLSMGSGRAVAIDRLFAIDAAADMRVRAIPTLRLLVGQFFPFGSGMGSFDAMFRIAEPFGLLKPTYFNHAHNDYAELLIEAGLPGALLLVGALVWWARASWRAWRPSPGIDQAGRLGSAMILLILAASAVDYPARTPLVMAVLAVSGCWLGSTAGRARS